MINKIKVKFECKNCGYKWDARVKKPSACPRCKRYDYNKKEVLSDDKK